MDERQLISDLRAREEPAFERLVHEHAGRLLAVARRIVSSDEEARDAVQEALLSAFRGIDRFQGASRLGTWLHRITVNAALMRLRSRRRRPEQPIDDLLPTFLADGHHAVPPPDWPDSVEDQLARTDTRRIVRDCIDRLPESYRTVLVLRDIQEMETDEVAQQLGLTKGAVKTRLHRARQALKTLLDPHLHRGDL
jgi:RNA polymerase sigma-70 factor (ECF subfamily)